MAGLACVVALGLGLRLHAALSWNLAYDEGWHIFAARVEPFPQFLVEMRALTHPPLSYLLMRPLVALGDSILWPRLLAVLSGAASIVALHQCCRRIGLARPTALLGAWVLALSYSHIQISAVVRGYSLTLLLLLAAFASYSEILRAPQRAKPSRVRGFLGFAALAMWSEYCAAFAVVAMFIILGLVASLRRRDSEALARVVRRSPVACLGFGAVTMALMAYLFWATGPQGNGHVFQFMPDGHESLTSFTLRGSAALLTYFTPWKFAADARLGAVLLSIALCLIVFARRLLAPRSAAFDAARGAAVVLPVLLLAQLLLASLLHLYPFGGNLRHQIVLLPFAIICVLTIFDTAYRAMRTTLPRCLLCGAAASLVGWLAVAEQARPPLEDFPPQPVWREEAAVVRANIADGAMLYLTSFNMNGLVGELRTWRWRVVGTCGPSCSLLEGTHAGNRMRVIQDRSRVVAPNPLDEAFLANISDILRGQRVAEVWLLSMQFRPPAAPQTVVAPQILERHGLLLQRVAQFREGELLRLRLRE